MKVHAFVFVFVVLGARGASINRLVDSELDTVNNVVKTQDVNLIIVDKVETNLRNAVETPVAIEEEQKLINEDNVPYIKEITGAKSAEMDLTNEDSNKKLEESQKLKSEMETDIVKIKIGKIQRLVNLYDKSISEMLKSPTQSNEDFAVIQCEVQNFKYLFSDQLADLKSTIESYINTRRKNLKTQLKSEDVPSEVDINSSLKKLTADFEKEMNVLSDAFDQLFSSEAIKGKAETSPVATSGSTSGNTVVVASGSSSTSTGDASTTSTTAASTTSTTAASTTSTTAASTTSTTAATTTTTTPASTTSTTSASTTSTTSTTKPTTTAASTTSTTKPTTSISQNQLVNSFNNYWNTFITNISSNITNIYQNYWGQNSSGNKS